MSFLTSARLGSGGPSVSDVVLSVYNARADAIATAQQVSRAQLANTNAHVLDSLGTANQTITLKLLGVATAAAPATTRAVSAALPGAPPMTTAGAATSPLPTAIVTFDISPTGGQGFVQSLSDHAEAHQTTHETAGGFYVDSFGLKPGDFSLEALVVYTSDAATQIQVFKDLLTKAKLLKGSVTTPPPRLLYTNSVNGRTLLLSQISLDIAESATNPNMANVTIRASILVDYAAAVKQVVPATVVSSPAASQLSLTTNSSGTLIDTATAIAGVAAQA
jgi:hypothetical protein